MQIKLSRWGNSLGVCLPGTVLAETSLAEGSLLEIIAEGGCLRLKPVQARPRKAYILAQLLKGVSPESVHPELDWGPDVDGEAIE